MIPPLLRTGLLAGARPRKSGEDPLRYENSEETALPPVRLAILGAGLIGRRHAAHVAGQPSTALVAVVDPSPGAQEVAAAHGVRWFPAFADLVAADKPDGVIIATPNRLHVENGLEAVAAGIPALVEKPIADDVAAATRLVEAAEAAGVPLLVGHHRRHNPVMRRAQEIVASGRLGRILAVQATCWFFKPDDYFAPAWRREAGAGPVLVNLIHDVDNLRALCGEVASVQALQSNAVRGHAVEDTAGILLRFASGAIATLSVSDAVVAPYSWEFTSGENPAYTRTQEACYLIGGTHGSLAVPTLDLWHNAAARSWWEPLLRERTPTDEADPLGLQVAQFARVIRGEEPPLVSGREGLATLKVIEAVKASAATGRSVTIG